MRRALLIPVLLGALLLLLGAAIAVALPQQQGSVDLLDQANGQWDGPGQVQAGSGLGSSVVGLPDIFGDGRGAFAVGAPQADPDGRQGAGSVYVVPGQSAMATIDLAGAKRHGYRIDGAGAGDQLGLSLAGFTLANGDPALVIGAPYASPDGRSEAGITYVIDLRKLHRNIDLAASRPGPAVVSVIAGPMACAQVGWDVADVGPVADGRADDLLVGAPGADPKGCPENGDTGIIGGDAGAAYLLYGSRLPAHLDLADAGAAITTFDGVSTGDRAGTAVAAGGRPGTFLIAAPDASPLNREAAGTVYLLHGATPGRTISLAAPPKRSTVFEGAVADDELGFAMAVTAGFAAGAPHTTDLALAAPQASPKGRSEAGEIYVVPAAGEPARVDLATLGKPGGARGGLIVGGDAGDEAGYALAAVGAVNGDGIADLAVGAPFVNSQTGTDRIDNGAAYVLYGGSGGLSLDLSHLRTRGFVAWGARNQDEAGTAVAAVSDENGDGRPDVLVGAPFAENMFGSTPTEGGAVYVLFGWGTPVARYPRTAETGTVGKPFVPLSPLVRATGAPSFSVTPVLPRGLRLNPRTGRISGTPRHWARRTVYTVQMSDLAGLATAKLALAVNP